MSAGAADLEQRADRWVAGTFGADHAVTRHLRRTLHWLERLRPGAGPALRLAALCHDMQCAEEVGKGAPGSVPASLTGQAYLAHHPQRGALLVAGFLAGAAVVSARAGARLSPCRGGGFRVPGSSLQEAPRLASAAREQSFLD